MEDIRDTSLDVRVEQIVGGTCKDRQPGGGGGTVGCLAGKAEWVAWGRADAVEQGFGMKSE